MNREKKGCQLFSLEHGSERAPSRAKRPYRSLPPSSNEVDMFDFLLGVGRKGEVGRHQIPKRGYEGSRIEEQDLRARFPHRQSRDMTGLQR